MTDSSENFTMHNGEWVFMLDRDPAAHRYQQNVTVYNLLLSPPSAVLLRAAQGG